MSEDIYLKHSLATILTSAIGNLTESNVEGASTFSEAVANVAAKLPFRGVVELTNHATLTDAQNGLVFRCDCATKNGNINITLPLMSEVDPWFVIILKGTGGDLQNVGIYPQSGNTIDKTSGITIGKIGQSMLILSGGKNGNATTDYVSLPFSKPFLGSLDGDDFAENSISFNKIFKGLKASILGNPRGEPGDLTSDDLMSIPVGNNSLLGRFPNEDVVQFI